MEHSDKPYLHSWLTEKIIAAAYKVYNTLGAGFLEKVYENALLIELKEMNLIVVQQYPIEVNYKDTVIGHYYADLLVEEKVIVELKAIDELSKAHEVQLVNYLKATGFKVGLLINFGDTIGIKRKILEMKSIHK